MWIALTGTPGTGKTAVGRILGQSGHLVIDLNSLVEEHGFVLGVDEERDTKVADVDALSRFLEKEYGSEEDVVLEGHWSHCLQVDGAVVLRCDPRVLRKRLEERDYSREKVEENVEAELVDVILVETVEALGEERTAEIDTTGLGPEETARAIDEVLNGDFNRYKAGNVDWSGQLLS